MRFCSKCFSCKNYAEFYKLKASKDGVNGRCKVCIDSVTMARYKKLKVYKYDRTKTKEQKREERLLYLRNRANAITGGKSRVVLSKEDRILRDKKYQTEYKRRKLKEDPLYKSRTYKRTNVSLFLKREKHPIKRRKFKLKSETEQMLGCDYDFIKSYIESKFQEGMVWSERSIRTWQIDHIIPLSSAKTEDDLYKLFHYTNMQPLWAKDNMKKGSKINYKI